MKKIGFFLLLVLCICSCETVHTTWVTVEVWNLTSNPYVLVDIKEIQKNVPPGEYEIWSLEWTETVETSFCMISTTDDSEEDYTYSISIIISEDDGATWTGSASRTIEGSCTLYVIISDGFFTISDDIYYY